MLDFRIESQPVFRFSVKRSVLMHTPVLLPAVQEGQKHKGVELLI